MTGSPLPSFEQFCAKQTSSSDSDDLTEQAIAMKGDWEEGLKKISTMSETMTTKWLKIDDIVIPKLNKIFEFRQLRNSLEFILGYWDTEKLNTKLGIEEKPVFETIFKIGLKRYKSVESKLSYKKLINVQALIFPQRVL